MPVNRYTARLLVGDAKNIIARFGPSASIYLPRNLSTAQTAKGQQQNRRVELVISGEVIGTEIGTPIAAR